MGFKYLYRTWPHIGHDPYLSSFVLVISGLNYIAIRNDRMIEGGKDIRDWDDATLLSKVIKLAQISLIAFSLQKEKYRLAVFACVSLYQIWFDWILCIGFDFQIPITRDYMITTEVVVKLVGKSEVKFPPLRDLEFKPTCVQ